MDDNMIMIGPLSLMLLFVPVLSWAEKQDANMAMVGIMLMYVCYLIFYWGVINPRIQEKNKTILKLEKKLEKFGYVQVKK